jgi:hypothetical protein
VQKESISRESSGGGGGGACPFNLEVSNRVSRRDALGGACPTAPNAKRLCMKRAIKKVVVGWRLTAGHVIIALYISQRATPCFSISYVAQTRGAVEGEKSDVSK